MLHPPTDAVSIPGRELGVSKTLTVAEANSVSVQSTMVTVALTRESEANASE